MSVLGMRSPVTNFTGNLGVARRGITPPLGIRAKNWGPATWEVAEGTHRPLTLTAVAFGSAETNSVTLLIAVDATYWRQVQDEWRFRSPILDALRLEPEQLMVNLSHTHSGPTLCSADSDLPGGKYIDEYIDSMSTAAIDAGRQALDNQAQGRIEWSVGRSSLASNRELVIDGRALVGFNPDEPSDDTVLVGRVTDAANKIIAVLVNYACHPTTLAWLNRSISPDYVGAMRDIVEENVSAPCIFLQGASGDLAPREQYSGEQALADRHGRSLGHVVLGALDSMPAVGKELKLTSIVESGADLAIWEEADQNGSGSVDAEMSPVEVDFKELTSLEDLEASWAGTDEHVVRERVSRERKRREGYAIGPTVAYPVWVWRIGDAIFVGQPGEAYSRFQVTLRERFPETIIVVMNLTNGPGFVYIPTVDAYERGAFQATQTLFSPGTLERVESHTITMIDRVLRGGK